LQYLAQNKQNELPVHDFIAKGMELKEETTFENGSRTVILNSLFKILEKNSLYEAAEVIISKFLTMNKNEADQSVGTAYVQYFLDISS